MIRGVHVVVPPARILAFFVPTALGTYSFHLTGTIKGEALDQKFTSGPATFGDMNDLGEVQYPVRQPPRPGVDPAFPGYGARQYAGSRPGATSCSSAQAVTAA